MENNLVLIVASNLGLIIIMVIVYLRYSFFRISSNKEIKILKDKINEELEMLKNTEKKLEDTTNSDNQRIKELLNEIDEIKRLREQEIIAKAEIEKQLELANLKNNELQQKMNEFQEIQDDVISNTKDAVAKMGNDLYRRVNESNKLEIETTKNLMGKAIKLIADYMEKITTAIPNKFSNTKNDANTTNKIAENNNNSNIIPNVNYPLINELLEIMKANGHLVNKNYFLASNFDNTKAKLMICEVGFIKSETFYCFDFKSCQYFDEYRKIKEQLKSQNKEDKENINLKNLVKNIEKNINYLSSENYKKTIINLLSLTNIKYNKVTIAMILPNKIDLQIMKTTKIYEKGNKYNVEMMSFDDINNIVL